MSVNNPFLIKGYISKEYFCNRENEMAVLKRNATNGADTTLISPRRMGKTGLIMRFFDEINPREFAAIYVDMYASRSLADFIKFLVEAVLKEFPEKSSFGKQFFNFLKGFRPIISFDSISGEPHVTLTYHTPQEKVHTLQSILSFLNAQAKTVILAIDEFQQITEYPEKNMEAVLRTQIQHLPNIRFVFCGSNRRLMSDIFSNAKRPFFSSTNYLMLDKIDENDYRKFIDAQFIKFGKKISVEAVSFILDWTKTHTFYTQSLCNTTFSITENTADTDTVRQACLILLKQNEPIYLQYKQMLTAAQWNFLIAVAKEDSVKQITAQGFISQHEIGTPSNARRISKSLINKELILDQYSRQSSSIQVYDVFFSRWLQREY